MSNKELLTLTVDTGVAADNTQLAIYLDTIESAMPTDTGTVLRTVSGGIYRVTESYDRVLEDMAGELFT